jgi:hypothetical protein
MHTTECRCRDTRSVIDTFGFGEDEMRRKLAALTILILVLPAALRGFWIGSSILQKSSGQSINISQVESEIADLTVRLDQSEVFSPRAVNTQSLMLDLQRSIEHEQYRQKNANQKPIAFFWIGASSLALAWWCFGAYLVLRSKGRTEPSVAQI